MAARILPFRSFVAVEKSVLFLPEAGSLRRSRRHISSSKVLMMSNHSRRRHLQDQADSRENTFAKVDHELANGYLEVEVTGLSLRRLTLAHAALLRGAWTHTLDSVRSLLRPTAAL